MAAKNAPDGGRLPIMATEKVISEQYVNVLEIKRDIVASCERRSNMPTYIQLLHRGHVEMQLVDGAFQFPSVNITNGPSMVVL